MSADRLTRPKATTVRHGLHARRPTPLGSESVDLPTCSIFGGWALSACAIGPYRGDVGIHREFGSDEEDSQMADIVGSIGEALRMAGAMGWEIL
jgi:hypothetical protein